MYTVVDLKLPKNLFLEKSRISNFFSFSEFEDTYDTEISIPVQESGGQRITILKCLVGEQISLRKSVTGVRLVRGSPDYSGYVNRIDMLHQLPVRVANLQRNYREIVSRPGSMFSNLCEEIVLPSGHSRTRDVRLLEQLAARRAGGVTGPSFDDIFRNREGVLSTTLTTGNHQITMNAGDFDGDTAGIMDFETFLRTQRPLRTGPQRSRDEFDQLRHYITYSRSFTGFTTSSPRGEPGPAPEYSPVPTAPVSLARAVDAVAEVVTGRRGTPPASRGPRPRNQRW